jgi:hypothetical protein
MPKTTALKVWADRRSGPIGCLAGNAVLAVLQDEEGEAILHEKGTTFVTSRKSFVGRMCSSDKYLQKGIVHFCNMSMQQHEIVMKQRRQVSYLFITVTGESVNYWIVPGKIVGQLLPSLNTKPDGTTRFLRISEKDGKYFLSGKNVTAYHKQLTLKPSDLAKVARERRRIASAPNYHVRDDGQVEVSVEIRGKQFSGVLQPA